MSFQSGLAYSNAQKACRTEKTTRKARITNEYHLRALYPCDRYGLRINTGSVGIPGRRPRAVIPPTLWYAPPGPRTETQLITFPITHVDWPSSNTKQTSMAALRRQWTSEPTGECGQSAPVEVILIASRTMQQRPIQTWPVCYPPHRPVQAGAVSNTCFK